MTSWIESQSTPVIAAIVFGLVYLAAAAIFLIAAWASRLPVGKHVGSLTPSLLSPLGTILGILIVFLAARVWTNVDRAHEYVSHEVSALREAELISKSLPPAVEEQVHADLKAHVQFLLSEEWPAMADRRADLKTRATHLEAAMNDVLAFSPEAENQKLAQSRALAAIESAFENRRYRIAISRTEIDPIQWIVVLLLSATVLITIASVHIHQRWAMAVGLFAFSTAIAICLVLLMEYDRPFVPGGFVISPADYSDAILD
ncbi:MAG TPA: DUF4239 domain-containing protein [Roseiarcus sp.]|jgi:hypothetical protein